MSEALARSIRTPSHKRQIGVLWLAFAVIIGISAFAFFTSPQLIASAGRAERTEALLVELTDLLSNLKDVETGSRGYALSDNDDRHLQRMKIGIASTNASVDRLKRLVTEPELRRSFDELFRLTTTRMALSQRLVAERRDPDKTQRNLADGLTLMDRIRAQVAVIHDLQEGHYQAERQALRRQIWTAGIAVAAGIALSLAVIGWLFALRGRELERQRRLEDDLRALNLELDGRVLARTAEVKQSQDLLNAVVDNLPDMIFLKEPANGFRYAFINKAGEAMFGHRRDEIIGHTDAELLPKAEADQFHRDSQEAVASGRPQTFTDRKLTNPSGVRIVETRKVPIADEAGGQLVLGIVRDVSSSRAMENQLRQLQRMDAIGQLTGGVAHDFNNLLAIVFGNAEGLRERVAGDADAVEMVDDVMAAASRGSELVRRLLAFARKQHLDPEPVDLNSRLSSIGGLLQRAIGEEVSLQVKTAPGLWTAIIDPTQVDDALVNLAINARDAMPDGGVLTIESSNAHFDAESTAHYGDIAPGEYVMLAVSDTGTGMSPETIRRAFEPFYTTKEEGKGSGLGLSQVFGWVKQSGGHINIYSELGHGTTVKLYLPRAETDIVAAPKAVEATPPRGNEMILVVEDNPNVRKTVIRQLHDLGYQTVEADCGARALELAKQGTRFDLLLTDVIMPGGITGYHLADALRETRPDLRVLFTSGYTELAAKGDKPRSDGLLSKPYRKQDLGRMVRAALDEARVAVPIRREAVNG